MKKILYISTFAPYDDVGHAGGQTVNYYLKEMARRPDTEISLLTFAYSSEMEKLDYKKYGIRAYVIRWPHGIDRALKVAKSAVSLANPFDVHCNMMNSEYIKMLVRALNKVKDHGYSPDVIIMEWTTMVLNIREIKNIFPDAKYVASEHDVMMLAAYRRYKFEKNPVIKKYNYLKAVNAKRRELSVLKMCDLVIPHNVKDEKILLKAGISGEKMFYLTPFYHRSRAEYRRKNNDILFYGYMKRMENESAAIWFIDNVMPLLSDIDVRFVIIGGSPSEKLKKKAAQHEGRVCVAGFVPEIDLYFAGAMCFAAPLIFGGGIKVKVIEAMYTGIPVMTNKVGIEGIPAENGTDYLHCETAEDYADAVKHIYFGDVNSSDLKGKDAIEKNFSLERSFENYYNRIMAL